MSFCWGYSNHPGIVDPLQARLVPCSLLNNREDCPQRNATGSRTERQRRYQGKPFFELGLPKRPVPYWRSRPFNKGILSAKEYMPCHAETHVFKTSDNSSNGNLFSAAF